MALPNDGERRLLPMIAVTPWNRTVQAPPSVNVLKTALSAKTHKGNGNRLTFGTSKDVEPNQKGIVEQEHNGGDLECDCWAPREQ